MSLNEESLERHGWATAGSPPQWLRGHATFDEGMIRLDSSTAELYTPSFAPELPSELSGVRRPSEAIKFVRDYGLLWHGPGASEFSEPYADWEHAIGTLLTVAGLYESLREATAGKGDATDRLRVFWEKPGASDEDILTEADAGVAILMSQGLDGVEMRLTPDSAFEAEVIDEDGNKTLQGGDHGKFTYMAWAESLLGYIYFHLSTALVTQSQLGTCPECMRFFVVRDPRQKYCSESCSYRSRYRRWKAKK